MAAFQSRAVLSPPQVMTVWPSGLKATKRHAALMRKDRPGPGILALPGTRGWLGPRFARPDLCASRAACQLAISRSRPGPTSPFSHRASPRSKSLIASCRSVTVIPAEATAKLTFRLVPGQDPTKILDNFERFVTARLRPDAKVEFKRYGAAPGLP